jgi:hypothetical protein
MCGCFLEISLVYGAITLISHLKPFQYFKNLDPCLLPGLSISSEACSKLVLYNNFKNAHYHSAQQWRRLSMSRRVLTLLSQDMTGLIKRILSRPQIRTIVRDYSFLQPFFISFSFIVPLPSPNTFLCSGMRIDTIMRTTCRGLSLSLKFRN